MACMKLGSKSEVFHLDGNTWVSSTGLPSDVTVEVGDMSFHLHKFPLLSRSGVLESLIGEASGKDEQNCTLQLHDVPGGTNAFLLVAKFCYGVKIELTAANVVSVRCAAEHLQMTEDYGEENLIMQTEKFLNEIFGNWTDSIKALETCEEVLPRAEEIHIVSRCITSLAMKACADLSLFSWPVSGDSDVKSPIGTIFWNGIRTASKSRTLNEDWWYEDVSYLRLPLYKRLITAIGLRGMKPEKVAGSIMHYTKRHLPLMGRHSSFDGGEFPASGSTISSLSDDDQRNLLEEIVELLPDQKGVTPTTFFLRLLRTSMILQASPMCKEKLEKCVGSQLDQAVLEDLLIPNVSHSMETLYDIECIQRILDHFMVVDRATSDPISSCVPDEGQLMGGAHSLTPMTMVANLVDGYLAEVGTDVNLKLPKFEALAAVIPDYARPLDDGIYRAIDIYLKAHPWLTDSEREQICRLMNCQKLSMDACTHAAQNERLPLRVIVQVLFFEQLRLRTSISGWFFVSDNLESSQNLSTNVALARTNGPGQGSNLQNQIVAFDEMKERVYELEKECLNMKEELQKVLRHKRGWNVFFKRLGFGFRSKTSDPKDTKPPQDARDSAAPPKDPLENGRTNHNNGELGDSK